MIYFYTILLYFYTSILVQDIFHRTCVKIYWSSSLFALILEHTVDLIVVVVENLGLKMDDPRSMLSLRAGSDGKSERSSIT